MLRQLGVGTPGSSPAVSSHLPAGTEGRESPSVGEIPLCPSPQEMAELMMTTNTKVKKSKLKKLSNKFSHDSKHKYKKNSTESENNDHITPTTDTPEGGRDSPASHRKTLRCKKSKSLSGDLTYELARVKLQCAESAHELEGKSLELKMALRREEFVLTELTAGQKVIITLEQKVTSNPYSCTWIKTLKAGL